MATATEILTFASENNCSNALALKVLTLQSQKAKLVEALQEAKAELFDAGKPAAANEIKTILRELGEL